MSTIFKRNNDLAPNTVIRDLKYGYTFRENITYDFGYRIEFINGFFYQAKRPIMVYYNNILYYENNSYVIQYITEIYNEFFLDLQIPIKQIDFQKHLQIKDIPLDLKNVMNNLNLKRFLHFPTLESFIIKNKNEINPTSYYEYLNNKYTQILWEKEELSLMETH